MIIMLFVARGRCFPVFQKNQYDQSPQSTRQRFKDLAPSQREDLFAFGTKAPIVENMLLKFENSVRYIYVLDGVMNIDNSLF